MEKVIKRNLFIYSFLLFLIAVSCREDIIVYPEQDYENFIYVVSNPSGAQIYDEGVNLGLSTPAWIRNIKPGTRYYTVKLLGYIDTSFVVTVNDSSKEYVALTLREE